MLYRVTLINMLIQAGLVAFQIRNLFVYQNALTYVCFLFNVFLFINSIVYGFRVLKDVDKSSES